MIAKNNVLLNKQLVIVVREPPTLLWSIHITGIYLVLYLFSMVAGGEGNYSPTKLY